MRVTETSYEEILTKILMVAALQGTSEKQAMSKDQLINQLEDWYTTNAPIGAKSLLEYVRYLDDFNA